MLCDSVLQSDIAALLCSYFFPFFIWFQERLKKVKSELGKAQLGNITVDMVVFMLILAWWYFSCPSFKRIQSHLSFFY